MYICNTNKNSIHFYMDAYICTQIGYTYLHILSLGNKYSVLKCWVYISAVKFPILGCSQISNLSKISSSREILGIF